MKNLIYYMRISRQREAVLVKLREQGDIGWIIDKSQPIGVSHQAMLDYMQCNMVEMNVIVSELLDEGFMDHYDTRGIKGWVLTQKGYAACSNKKYKKDRRDAKWSEIKNWISVLVPIISLGATLFVVIRAEFRAQDQISKGTELQRRIQLIEYKLLQNRNLPKTTSSATSDNLSNTLNP